MNKQDKQFFIQQGIIKGPAKSQTLVFIEEVFNFRAGEVRVEHESRFFSEGFL